MVIHTMKLQESEFDRIRSGRKTIELRLFDEKRKKLNLGDSIEFTSANEINLKFNVKIIALLHYPRFQELILDFGMDVFGYPQGYSLEKYLESMYTLYSKENEKKYGVIGIKLKLLDSFSHQ